jgi:hypothetical protein
MREIDFHISSNLVKLLSMILFYFISATVRAASEVPQVKPTKQYFMMSQRITGLEDGRAFRRSSTIAFEVDQIVKPGALSTYDISVEAIQTLFAPGVNLTVSSDNPKLVMALSRDPSTERIEGDYPSPIIDFVNSTIKEFAGQPMLSGTGSSSIEPPKDKRLNSFFNEKLRFSHTIKPLQLNQKQLILMEFITDAFFQMLPSGNRIEGCYSGTAVIDAAKMTVYFLATRFDGKRMRGGHADPFLVTSLLLNVEQKGLAPIEFLERSEVFREAVEYLDQKAIPNVGSKVNDDLPIWAREAWLAGEIRSIMIGAIIEHRTNPIPVLMFIPTAIPLLVMEPIMQHTSLISLAATLGMDDNAAIEKALGFSLSLTGLAVKEGIKLFAGVGLVSTELAVGQAINRMPILYRVAAGMSIGLMPGNMTTIRDLSVVATRIQSKEDADYYTSRTGECVYLLAKNGSELLTGKSLNKLLNRPLYLLAKKSSPLPKTALRAALRTAALQRSLDKLEVMKILKQTKKDTDILKLLKLGYELQRGPKDAAGPMPKFGLTGLIDDFRSMMKKDLDPDEVKIVHFDPDELGGVDLSVNRAIEQMDHLDHTLAGVTIDGTNGIIRFLMDPGKTAQQTTIPKHEILYTALALMQYYGDISNITFSLDPVSRKAWDDAIAIVKNKAMAMATYQEKARDQLIQNIKLPQRPRYDGAPVERTAIGHIMLHADMALKSSIMGYDYRTGKRFFISEEHERLVNEAMLNASEVAAMARFWFYLEKCNVHESERSFRIDMHIRVKTTGVDWHGTGGAYQDSGSDDPHLRALTNFIADHLDEFARRFPIINDLEETYRLLIMLDVLKRRGIDLPDVPAISLKGYDDPDVVEGMAAIYAAPELFRVAAFVGGVVINLGQQLETNYSPQGVAVDGLAAAFELKPSGPSLRRSDLYTAGLTKDLGRIVSAYKSMEGSTQNDPYALMVVARAHFEAGKSEKAVEYARRGLKNIHSGASASRTFHVPDVRLVTALEDIQMRGNLVLAIRQRERTTMAVVLILSLLLATGLAVVVSLHLIKRRRSGVSGASGRSKTEISKIDHAPVQKVKKPVRILLGADGIFKKINDEDE